MIFALNTPRPIIYQSVLFSKNLTRQGVHYRSISRKVLLNFQWKSKKHIHYYNHDGHDKKEFIMSILSSTATRREAKDYMKKYASGEKFNACVIVLQDLFTRSKTNGSSSSSKNDTPMLQSSHLLSGFTSTVLKLQGLGVKPIIVIDENCNKEYSYEVAKLLDLNFSQNGIRSRMCPEVITKNEKNEYELSYPVYEDIMQHGVIPIVEPVVFDEISCSKKLTQDLPQYISQLIKLLMMENKTKDSKKNLTIEKIFILNEFGGIPSIDRNNYSHVFVNICDEYDIIHGELEKQIDEIDKRSGNNTNIERGDDLGEKIQYEINKQFNDIKIDTFKQSIKNLKIMELGLKDLPLSATGVISRMESCCFFENDNTKRNPLLYNVLTDRSLISSSLPSFKKIQNENDRDIKWYETSFPENGKFITTTAITTSNNNNNNNNNSGNENIEPEDIAFFYTTVLKKGVDIKFFDYKTLNQYNSINLPSEFWTNNDTPTKTIATHLKLDMGKFTKIINSSFNRELDLSHYLRRINGNIASIIVIGDYEGIAILTYEPTHTQESITCDKTNQPRQFAYLDKFAVMPHLKGSLGISDIIFNEMFKKFGKGLLWRSRKDNVVNKWYFQRSSGSLDLSIDLGNGDIDKDCIFRLFYYGDNDNFTNIDQIYHYAKCIRDIKPSWKS